MNRKLETMLVIVTVMIVIGFALLKAFEVKETKDISTSKTGDWLNKF